MIRIASYNIRKAIGRDRRRRPERILGVLAEIAADIVVLQEADRRFGKRRASSLPPEVISAQTHYRAIDIAVRPHSIGWHGNAILVREGIEVLSARRLELPALEPRGAVMVEVLDGERGLRVVGAHLSLLARWRQLQAAAIERRLDETEGGMPTVLIGDFNAWTHEAPSLEPIARRYLCHAPGKSYPAHRPVAPLDRLFFDKDVTLVNAGVHDSALARVASDHLPIWADLEPQGPALAAQAKKPRQWSSKGATG